MRTAEVRLTGNRRDDIAAIVSAMWSLGFDAHSSDARIVALLDNAKSDVNDTNFLDRATDKVLARLTICR